MSKKKLRESSKYLYEGNALPAGNHWNSDFPYAAIVDHNVKKPPHLDEILARKEYGALPNRPFGPMKDFEPQKLVEYYDHFEKQGDWYQLNQFAINAVDLKSIYDRSRLDDLRPQIKEGHRRARDKMVGLSERLFHLLTQRCIKTEDDLEFLYGLLDPQVMIPLFPVSDPFGMWFWEVYADPWIGGENSSVDYAISYLPGMVTPNRMQKILSGLQIKSQYVNLFSALCKGKMVKRMIPGYENATKEETENFLKGIFYTDAIDPSVKAGTGWKVDKDRIGGKLFADIAK